MARWWWQGRGQELSASVHDHLEALLPHDPPIAQPVPPKAVTIVALRLKYQLEAVIPCELPIDEITRSHSHIITKYVVKTAANAGGDEHRACVVFALLIVKKWFKAQAGRELWDADVHNARATACEVIAKQIIETEDDMAYLLGEVLLKRYSIVEGGEDTKPANVVERAVDLHALTVIGSSGYQKCISHLWRGWLVQDGDDPSRFVDYRKKVDTRFWAHFDPDRMRVPRYQNMVQILMSLIYLVLYSFAVNTINPTGDLDIVEGLLYLFTLGFVCDELSKLWKVGIYYISFWNTFNSTLYALLAVSFITRMIALSHDVHSGQRKRFNEMSYNFLAFSAPLFWGRLCLYLDTFRFFGVMMVVMKVMMRESIIFFAMLFIILVGFLQAFVGLDQVDNNVTAVSFVVKSMLNAIMTSPDFDGFDNYAPPFGLILYYLYTFVVMVVLLNILIALYNSAYADITDNAADEYMALFAQKTMQFVRAPDENVFIAPFNLVEIFGLVIPFEWWMSRKTYARVNDYVMAGIYSPLLLVTAFMEKRQAFAVHSNRRRGAEEDDVVEPWEELEGECDFKDDGWAERVEGSKPNLEVGAAVREVGKLRDEVRELKKLILELKGDERDGN
ncbi:receptor-activated Ca2+-permeable cation channel [Trichodelitschia bisporula]|uniref:Receptor-activated Ca2+-permeable cation channel n=1 Tax=Trichodelitschia bisporula TaxID=703511 RepID=A0A6G1I1E0_9PEZI|nr:receptor-activated Ca2+-permeable cation channel [Trichodelitschia bisporula]